MFFMWERNVFLAMSRGFLEMKPKKVKKKKKDTYVNNKRNAKHIAREGKKSSPRPIISIYENEECDRNGRLSLPIENVCY